ncbi:Bacterial type II secretion system protein G [Gimesia aquarii]|uniref:Bacterial type II secretion system protein G n=2 Tax=Gimesia aquarii TaxID=2527964 RepID=A0A517VQX0_9PLAN|nr:Bacterial type II secretion system protein G [Gimesia aquarii]
MLLLGCEQTSDTSEMPEQAQRVTRVAYVVLLFRKEHGRLPESMDEILEYDDSTPRIDHWGNEFQYEFEGDEFTVYSAGPDKQVGTEDDLRAELESPPSE